MSRPSVKTKGQVITSDWANELRDQLVLYFADATARDAAIATPTPGMTCYVASLRALLVYDSLAGWMPPWNVAWGKQNSVKVSSGVTGGASATFADTTGMTFTFNAVLGRAYRIYYRTQWNASADTEMQIQVLVAGTVVVGNVQAMLTGEYKTIEGLIEVTGLTTGTKTVKMQHANDNAVTVSPSYASTSPFYLGVDDIGPSGVS